MKKTIYFSFFLILLPIFSVHSQSLTETSGLSAAAGRTNLIKGVSVQTLIARIINGLLSFLGMLFTVLIIYGGFKWMLARGNSQQVEEAKNVIKNAATGLAIVVLSYVIVYAVLQILEGSLDQAGPPAQGGG